MTIAWSDVIAFAPELTSAPVTMQTAVLARVNAGCPVEVWGDSADYGRSMQAAHLATMLLRRGAVGAVSSQTAGPVSQSYAAPLAGAPYWAGTSYGQEYYRVMRNLALARLPIIGGM